MDAMHNPNEPLIRILRMIIRFGVRCMAILMTLVILLGVGDVAMEIYNKLMAIARKVIILDFKTITPDYMFATAALIFAMSIGYWLVLRNADGKTVYCDQLDGRFNDSEECELRDEHSMASSKPKSNEKCFLVIPADAALMSSKGFF